MKPRSAFARALFALSLGAAAALAASSAAEARRAQIYAAPNDAFADAEALTPGQLLIPGTISYASRELGERKIYPDSSIGRTVWYRYTAPSTGRAVLLLTHGYSDYSPFQMAVYTGKTLKSLKLVDRAQVRGTEQSPARALSFPTTKNETYYVQVDAAPDPERFQGGFLLGVQQFGTAGDIAMFLRRPIFIDERCCGYDRDALAANGFPLAVTLTSGVSGLGSALTIDSSDNDLAVGEVSVFTISDASADFDDGTVKIGSLDVIAKSAANGRLLGSGSAPVTVVDSDFSRRPAVEVRHLDPSYGVRLNARASTRTMVRNTSAVDAIGCRFEPNANSYYSAFAIDAREVLAGGKFGPSNTTFTLKAGETKTFSVSSRSGSNDYNSMYLYCADYYRTVSTNGNAYFDTINYRGPAASVRLRPVTDTAFGEVALNDFATRRVSVDLTNVGPYSGYFKLTFDDDTYKDKAVVAGLCIAEGKKSCSPTGTGSLTFDLAVGETRRVTMAVRRGSAEAGEVKLYVEATDDTAENSGRAGYNAFWVVPK